MSAEISKTNEVEEQDEDMDLDFMNILPDELLEEIFKKLDTRDLVSVGHVCERFMRISKGDQLWKFRSLILENHTDDESRAVKKEEFINHLNYAPAFKKVTVEDQDVRDLFLMYCWKKRVRQLLLDWLPPLFECFDCDYLEDIEVKYLDFNALNEILSLPHLKKLAVVLFLDNCCGHPGQRIASGSSCLSSLLVRLSDHHVLCGLIESHHKSLTEIKVFANDEEGPTYLMDKIILCSNLSTLAISHIKNSHLLLNMVQLRKFILWPDPEFPFHAEYLPHIPKNVESLTLCSWAAEHIAEEYVVVIECCRRLPKLRELKMYISYWVEESSKELMSTLQLALPNLNIIYIHTEEEVLGNN